MIVVVGLLAFGGKDDGLSRRKSRIGACIPAPNEDVTMPIGAKMLTEAVFRDTGLDDLLDSLKRDQGVSVSKETVALVANSLEMTGISVNRIDSILDDEDVRAEYGLGAASPKSLYRTVERLGRNVDHVISHLGGGTADAEVWGDPRQGAHVLDLDVLRGSGERNCREVRAFPRPPARQATDRDRPVRRSGIRHARGSDGHAR